MMMKHIESVFTNKHPYFSYIPNYSPPSAYPILLPSLRADHVNHSTAEAKIKQIENELLAEKEQREELERMINEYEEELKDKDTLIKELKAKYKSKLSKIRDEKESLLDSIREQNSVIKFYKKVVDILLTAEELEEIQKEARWSEELNEWVIEAFRLQYLQSGLFKLPKILLHPESPNIENEDENKLEVKIYATSESNTIRNNPKTRQANNPDIEYEIPQLVTYYSQSPKIKFNCNRVSNNNFTPKVSATLKKSGRHRLVLINQPLISTGRQCDNPEITRNENYLAKIGKELIGNIRRKASYKDYLANSFERIPEV